MTIMRNNRELWRVFKERTRSYASKPAISTSSAALTFSELFDLADSLADSFAKAGVKEGSLVALVVPSSFVFVPAFLALTKLSCVVAMVSPKYKDNEFRSLDEGLTPDCYITFPSLSKVIESVLPASSRKTLPMTNSKETLEIIFAASTTDKRAPAKGKIDNLSIIKLTSGSTGIPKGIGVTVDNIVEEAENIVSTLEIDSADTILAPVPIFHSYGFDVGVLPMLYTGASLILHDIFVPRRIFADLEDKNVSIFLGVPSTYRFLAETRVDAAPDLSHIRYLLSCTAPLSPSQITAFFEKYHMSICQHYGSSETGAVTNHIPAEVTGRPKSVGRPLHNVAVRIVDETGHELPPGQEGEIVVRSKVVAPGYVMGEPEDQSGFIDGDYWTGDLGIVDDEGYVYVRGRKDQIINVGGLKVSPIEVIDVLTDCPSVSEAAVIGAKDALGEEAVFAMVTLNSEATETEILAFCKTRLADYKIPRRIVIREELPKGNSGKVVLRPEDLDL
jgi:long-chain acyl-CoA synthetase